MFIGLLRVWKIGIFGRSLASHSKDTMKCLSLNNCIYEVRPALVDRNTDETLFYQFIVNFYTCGGSCNTIDDPLIHP